MKPSMYRGFPITTLQGQRWVTLPLCFVCQKKMLVWFKLLLSYDYNEEIPGIFRWNHPFFFGTPSRGTATVWACGLWLEFRRKHWVRDPVAGGSPLLPKDLGWGWVYTVVVFVSNRLWYGLMFPCFNQPPNTKRDFDWLWGASLWVRWSTVGKGAITALQKNVRGQLLCQDSPFGIVKDADTCAGITLSVWKHTQFPTQP